MSPPKKRPAPADGKKDRRGRKPKVAKPRAAAQAKPPAEASPEPSIDDAMKALLLDAKTRAAKHLPLANHHTRVLRDEWLMAMEQYFWASSAAAAADLGISVGTLRGYRDKGCPGIEDHSPIPKHLVLAWLLNTAHERGGDRGVTNNDIEAEELRGRQIKNAKASGELVSQAEDRATQGVIRTIGQVRNFLQNGLPAVLYALALKHTADRAVGEEALSQAIEVELRRFLPQLRAGVLPAPQATPPATESGAQTTGATP